MHLADQITCASYFKLSSKTTKLPGVTCNLRVWFTIVRRVGTGVISKLLQVMVMVMVIVMVMVRENNIIERAGQSAYTTIITFVDTSVKSK